MKNVFVDNNGRAIQVAPLSYGENYGIGVIPNTGGEYVRVKAISDSVIKISAMSGNGVMLSEGDTEYFYIPEGKNLEVVSGSINLMF